MLGPFFNTLISFSASNKKIFVWSRVQINVWGSALALTTDRFCHMLFKGAIPIHVSWFFSPVNGARLEILPLFFPKRRNLTGWGNLSDWAYGHSAEKRSLALYIFYVSAIISFAVPACSAWCGLLLCLPDENASKENGCGMWAGKRLRHQIFLLLNHCTAIPDPLIQHVLLWNLPHGK